MNHDTKSEKKTKEEKNMIENREQLRKKISNVMHNRVTESGLIVYNISQKSWELITTGKVTKIPDILAYYEQNKQEIEDGFTAIED